MSDLVVAPIVEGQGDEAAVRLLLQRIWVEIVGGAHVEVLKPIRRSRGLLLRKDSGDLEKAVQFALLKLAQRGGGLVLLLIDAEEDCAKFGPLGPLLLERMRRIRPDKDVAVVVANVMFETWFVAAAESLDRYLDLGTHTPPADPETARAGKGWIKKRMRSGKYSETADQAALVSCLNLQSCRGNSRSFRKLCVELQRRFRPSDALQPAPRST